MPEQKTQEQTPKQAKKKALLGTVIGDRMNKTIRVKVDRQVRHPLYGKYLTRSTCLLVHDEENTCRVGDVVEMEPSRPLSRHKAWRLRQVVTRAERVTEELPRKKESV